MNQQVTYRVGRGVPSPAPKSGSTLLDWALDILPRVILPAMFVAAVFFTAVTSMARVQ